MRELREFREHHDNFADAGIRVAGVSADTLESHRQWSERLRIPYPLVSDTGRRAAHALGLVMKFGIAGWSVELFRRTTLLVGADGRVAAAWGKVKVRGHAEAVLAAARGLPHLRV